MQLINQSNKTIKLVVGNRHQEDPEATLYLEPGQFGEIGHWDMAVIKEVM